MPGKHGLHIACVLFLNAFQYDCDDEIAVPTLYQLRLREGAMVRFPALTPLPSGP